MVSQHPKSPSDPAGIEYRWMEPAEMQRLGEIERAEHITRAYLQHGCQLTGIPVDWQAPNWSITGEHDHSLRHHRSFCRDHLVRGGLLLGAFAAAQLAGIALLQPQLMADTAQLAYLHVSRGYRRRGIASTLVNRLFAEARRRGARQIYVSATNSQSAVGFYLRHGFKPVAEPHPELYALEPEDIHMLRQL